MHPLSHHAPAAWAVSVPLTVFLLVLFACYVRGWLRMRSAGQMSAARILSFFVGIVLLWLALSSPLASSVHRFLAAHMVQHLLLMTIAPALLLMADPWKVLQAAMPSSLACAAGNFSHVPPLPWLGAFLTNPVLCWLASTAALVGWHIPGIFSRSFESPALHHFEQCSFVFAGLLFWWPVIQPWPARCSWPRWLLLVYLFLATLPCDILSAYLTFCERVVYAPYLLNADSRAALRDQEFAGALMWTCITLFYLIPAAILTVHLLQRPAIQVGPDSSRTA